MRDLTGGELVEVAGGCHCDCKSSKKSKKSEKSEKSKKSKKSKKGDGGGDYRW